MQMQKTVRNVDITVQNVEGTENGGKTAQREEAVLRRKHRLQHGGEYNVCDEMCSSLEELLEFFEIRETGMSKRSPYSRMLLEL